MHIIKFRELFGLAGVDKNENPTANKWGHRFEIAMILLALWLPLQWYLDLTGEIPHRIIEIASWIIWFFFVMETAIMLCLTTHKREHLLRNWMNLVIIAIGIPPIWLHTPLIAALRILQLLLLFRLLLPVWGSTVTILSRNRLGATLIVACAVTVLWGILMSIVDPNIATPWDGIWLAWETVTTVGFGDNVPTSVLGRILDIILMIMGIGLISLLTANFSAYFIGRNTDELKREDKEILHTMKQMQQQIAAIQEQLSQLNQEKTTNKRSSAS